MRCGNNGWEALNVTRARSVWEDLCRAPVRLGENPQHPIKMDCSSLYTSGFMMCERARFAGREKEAARIYN